VNGTANAKFFNPKSNHPRIGELIDNPFPAVLLSLTEDRHLSNLENTIGLMQRGDESPHYEPKDIKGFFKSATIVVAQ
jgi:hypothetical protein